MSIIKGKRALEKIAKERGITVQEVRMEIQAAIDEAISHSSPEIRALWKSMAAKGEKPTPEEAITFLAKKIEKNKRGY